MNAAQSVALESIMPPRLGSVDPSAFPDEEFDLYSIPAFDQRAPEVRKGSEIGSAKQIVTPGDVLLSRIVPHIRRAWVVGKSRGRRIIASGEWIVFRGEAVEPKYLRHVLVSDLFHAEYMRTVSGVGGSLLRARPAYVAKINVPLPPLPEQRRIADILDRADALRAQRRAALAQLDALPQAIFLEMFGDLDTNPNGFPVSSVGELALVQGGLQLSSSRKNIGASIPYLRVANVYRNRLDLSEIKHMKASPNEVARTRLMSGDILVVEGHGNPNEIGRAAMWRGEIETCVHQNHLIRIRVDQASLQPQFLCHLLNSRGGRKHLLRSGKTTSGLNTITVSEVRLAPIFVPPNFLQTEFDVRVKAIERLQSSYSSFLANSDSLFASLQHRAFRGEL